MKYETFNKLECMMYAVLRYKKFYIHLIEQCKIIHENKEDINLINTKKERF